jgi:hypothetical protein
VFLCACLPSVVWLRAHGVAPLRCALQSLRSSALQWTDRGAGKADWLGSSQGAVRHEVASADTALPRLLSVPLCLCPPIPPRGRQLLLWLGLGGTAV